GGAAAFPHRDPGDVLDPRAGDGVDRHLWRDELRRAAATREFGIRLSIGATRRDVLRLVLGRAAVLIGAGTALGLGGAVVIVRLIANLIFRTARFEPLTFAAVPLVLAAMALLASYIPARRATLVDPMVALGYDMMRHRRSSSSRAGSVRVAIQVKSPTVLTIVPAIASAVELMQHAEKAAEATGSPNTLGTVRLIRAYLDYLMCRIPQGIQHSREAVDFLRERCTGVAWEMTAAYV